ncbi:MAG: hypothetical protein ABEJ78_02040 [Haloferacaceae archaeon]
MAMTPYITAASALSAVTVILLVALVTVWLRNYRQFRTPLTLGLVAFGAVLLVENLVALSFYFSMGMLYAGSETAQLAVLGMRALQFLAVLAITYVSMK